MDFHHNLFYGYRGPSLDDADRDRQLENNLTKALINTLSLGGEEVWRPFLEDLGLANARDASFLLQRRDLPSGRAAYRRQRLLLGITRAKSRRLPGAHGDSVRRSLPDAWVYGTGFAILVESKVEGDFSEEQIQAHLDLLQPGDAGDAVTVLRTWSELHGLFRALLPGLRAASARLLVTQFCQYLEYSGMSGFNGFRREHLDYFLLHDDEDARRWVLDQVGDFARQLQDRLRQLSPFYEGFEVGSLKRTSAYCWVAFGPSKGRYRDVTHQSVSLGADGLKVFVNAELKAATDKVKSVVAHEADRFQATLGELHEFAPFDLLLEERVQKQSSIYDYTPKLRLHSSMLAEAGTRDVAWQAFSQTVLRLPLPYLRIERLLAPRVLLARGKSDEPPIDLLVRMLASNHTVVDLLNA